MLLRYAWRNISRHPTRSALTTFAVIVSVAMLLVGHAMIEGLRAHVVNEFAKQTGDVRLRHPDYERESRFDPLEYNIDAYGALHERLMDVSGVRQVLGRIQFRVMVQYTDESTIVPESAGIPEDKLTDEQIFGRKVVEFAPAIGLEPGPEREVSRLQERLVDGRYFSDDAENEVVLGSDLARRLGIKSGVDVQIVSYRKGVSDVGAKVVGVVDYGNRFANRLAHLPLKTSAKLLEMPDEVTDVLVLGPGLDAASALKQRLVESGLVANLEVKAWSEIGMARLVSTIFSVVLTILLFFIVAVAGVNLLNTMMMTVLERQKEIGVLLALGMKRLSVVRVFVLEALAFGVVGCLAGAAIGSVVAEYLHRNGIKLGEGTTRKMFVPVSDTVHAIPTVQGLFFAVGVGLAVAFLGALGPAIRASRVHPIEAMRNK
jgi:putative ABC transport system permease protein